MPLPVNLRAVVDEMEIQSDQWKAYINRKTGELITISEEEAIEAEDFDGEDDDDDEDEEGNKPAGTDLDRPSKIKEVLSSEDFLRLPTKYEIHEWSIMERFAQSLDDDEASERLERAIRGSGAFRYFRDVIHELGLVQRWYAFRDASIARIARRWLEAHEIPFVDDMGGEVGGSD